MLRNDSDKYFVNVLIEGKIQRFEVDSGAGLTLLPESAFKKLKLKSKIQKTTTQFRSYTSEIFAPLGYIQIQVEYKEKISNEIAYIVPDRFSPLLGRDWIRRLNIELKEIDKITANNINQVNSIDISNMVIRIEERYKRIFTPEVGAIHKFSCSLKLRSNSKPVFIKAREVPYALKEKVEKELIDLEAEGIITKVESSDWGSPLLVIPKPDGKLRLCVDYKVAVNPQLESAHYPIPKIETILNNLRNSKYFCTIDLYKAYLHVLMDEGSKKIQTISTQRGTYLVNRLSFGIKTAPSEFHRILDQILTGLDGIITYFDDIIIHGESIEQTYQRLIKCLEKLEEYNLHINRQKCHFFKEELSYLGYVISHNKIAKCPKKIEAITNMKRPINPEEVKRFLGMITYYSKFMPNTSTITYPLRCLLRKEAKFKWTTACEAAFMKLKEEIASSNVLIPFNPKLPLTLACDASPTGIAAVLSYIVNGIERPIAFASRSLTTAEQNYSQLDREALAIVFAVDKFFMYTYGRKFDLITDNRPLTHIFKHDTNLPRITAGRLLRYATFLQSFDYTIKHRKAEEHVHVDCLSRAPLTTTSGKIESIFNLEVEKLQEQSINQISSITLNHQTLITETKKDAELAKLKKDIQTGETVDPEITIEDDIVFKRNRIMIPKSLQSVVLEELHHTHVGIVKMKQLARRYVYWKQIDQDIEHQVKSCEQCALVKKSPPKTLFHTWDEPQENFERIHIDYAGPYQGYYFLVVVDAKSKWIEVKHSKSAPTTESTIRMLQEIFGFHGLPRIMVSDNATIFQSEQFKKFCNELGIFQKFIAPGHPATNGLAERTIQTLKTKLAAMSNEETSMTTRINEILYRYRATPLSCGKTPSERYLGRNLRLKLDMLKPFKEQPTVKITTRTKVRNLSVGDRVQARWVTNNKATWRFGIIKKKFGRLHYLIRLDSGYTLKRHIDQLRHCYVEDKEEEIAGSQKSKKTVRVSDSSELSSNGTQRNNTQEPDDHIWVDGELVLVDPVPNIGDNTNTPDGANGAAGEQPGRQGETRVPQQDVRR